MGNDSPFISPGNPARFLDNSGESRLDRVNGVLAKSDDGGGTYSPLGGGSGFAAGSAEAALTARSASIMGSNSWAYEFDDFEAHTLNRWSVLGPPVQDATHGFGVWTCVNTNTFIGFKTIVAVANPSVTPWHVAGRMRLATAAGAAEVKGFSLDSGSADFVRVGLQGAQSTAKFSATITKASVLVASALSTVNVDTTNFHVFELWFDGTSCWMSVDGETPVFVCAAATLPVVALCDRWGTGAAAGGALGAYYDYFYSAAARTAT
jgi:hypothetical protein